MKRIQNEIQNDPERGKQKQPQKQLQLQLQNQNDRPADRTKPHLRQFIGRTLLPSERPAHTPVFWSRSETRLTREFKNQQKASRK